MFSHVCRTTHECKYVPIVKCTVLAQEECIFRSITSNHRKAGVNVLGLLNRFSTSNVKCWTVNFCIHAGKGPVIIMRQSKSLYNSPFKDSYSHPIHTCFAMIASNEIFKEVYFALALI